MSKSLTEDGHASKEVCSFFLWRGSKESAYYSCAGTCLLCFAVYAQSYFGQVHMEKEENKGCYRCGYIVPDDYILCNLEAARAVRGGQEKEAAHVRGFFLLPKPCHLAHSQNIAAIQSVTRKTENTMPLQLEIVA